MRLFIAEKPTLGRAIANGLGNQKKDEGCIHCGDDTVTWCFGHLLMQCWPEDYNPAYQAWLRKDLPIIPQEWRLKPKDKVGAQLKIIKNLLAKAQVVVNAGDPDREGQLLVDEVLEYFNWKGPVERIWLASLDDRSVKKALASIKDNAQYAPLRDSALARSRADWLIGINATRALSIRAKTQGKFELLSLGRVQTPTLALVVARDAAIASFKSVDHYLPCAEFAHANGNFRTQLRLVDDMAGLDADGRMVDLKAAENLVSGIKDQNGEIAEAACEVKSKMPPLPHCLSSLQKAASSRFGFSAQEVLDTAQSLYEKKLTTYPRTDCRYLPNEQLEEAASILKSLSELPDFAEMAGSADANLRSSAWNTKKITAHHAIVPTGEKPGELSDRERKLYGMIAEGFILQFYPSMRYESRKVTALLGENFWTASGRNVLEAGWTSFGKVEEEEAEDGNASLPQMNKGDSVQCVNAEVQKKKTIPPSKFTEGTLIEAMANVHRFVDDAKAKVTLKEAKGIGTEATRAKVIEILKERKFIQAKGKNLVSTQLGQRVIELAPQSLRDPITTAEWEEKLEEISKGNLPFSQFMDTQNRLLPDLMGEILGNEAPAYPCPKCGEALVRRKSKKGEFFWSCSAYPECRYSAPDENGKPGKPRGAAAITDFKCPQCGKPLRKLSGPKGEFFGCSGYPDCKKTFFVMPDGKPNFNPRPKTAQQKDKK